jgi:general L-amino acid transport system ATP-binding protein
MNALATLTVSQTQVQSDGPRSEDIIICRDVHKWYGGYHAVRGVTTRIHQGETVVIIGPSGSGKSTFLRTINQLEEHQRGDIIVDGVLLNRDTRNIDAVRRNIGMVSQDFILFPNMSILDNITLAPKRVLKENPREARERAMEILSRVGIPEQAGKHPHQLSCGQQQLAAIARALAMKPRIMLLDEPTSAMDVEMGEVLEVMRGLAQSRMTVMAVTHEMGFAREAADRIVFFDEGQIVEDRPPEEFFQNPRHSRTKRFLEKML